MNDDYWSCLCDHVNAHVCIDIHIKPTGADVPRVKSHRELVIFPLSRTGNRVPLEESDRELVTSLIARIGNRRHQKGSDRE